MRMKRPRGGIRGAKNVKAKEQRVLVAENLHYALAASVTDPLVILNIDGTAASVNSSFEETFGWTCEEIRGHVLPYIPKAERTRTMKRVREALRGKPFRFETSALTKNGRALAVILTGHRFCDAENEPAGLVITLRGVTAVKRLQDALPLWGRELEEFLTEHDDDSAAFDEELKLKMAGRIKRDRELEGIEDTYRRMFEGRSLGLAIFDREGGRLHANKRFTQMLGCSPDESPRLEDCLGLMPLKWQARSPSDWRNIPGHATFRCHEVERNDKNGKRLVLLASGGILEKRADGNHLMVVSLVDVTARNKLHEKLRVRNEKLSARVAALGERLKEQTHDLDMSREELARLRKNLKRVNDAMKILILDFQEQKKELENRIVNNFRLTVEPLIEQFRSLSLPKSQRYLLETLDFSIRHITSYFGINVGRKGGRLTRREIEICQMIRQGKDSREIAQAVGLSYQTVIVHRKNIRKKLGIKKTKQNLASFIQESMQ